MEKVYNTYLSPTGVSSHRHSTKSTRMSLGYSSMFVLYLEGGWSESSFQLENTMMLSRKGTLKTSINTLLFTCDDKESFDDDDTFRKHM
jgi:hypothetical protein